MYKVMHARTQSYVYVTNTREDAVAKAHKCADLTGWLHTVWSVSGAEVTDFIYPNGKASY